MVVERPGIVRELLSPHLLLTAWLPALAITVLHYITGPEYHWLHDVLRRLYYLPILFAAFSCGLRGGLVLAALVSVAYSPHAFTHLMHMDPAHTLEKSLELLLYFVVGGVAGILVDRERRRRQEATAATARAEQALAEQQRTADQLVRAGRLAALGELVAGIAHEIKNPLHGLRGTAEVVDPAVARDAPQRRMWELHLRELDRLEKVSERFLSFARPTPLERETSDLQSVVERTAGLLEAQARQQGVELVIEEPHGELPRVPADHQQLAQVLLNISLNALQAMEPHGGTIRYSLGQRTRGDRSYARVQVQNDGPAIPAGELECIFDPFVTTKSAGAGLGLSIAARIVEQHDGFLEVKNIERGADRRGAQGVVFTVLLPL